MRTPNHTVILLLSLVFSGPAMAQVLPSDVASAQAQAAAALRRADEALAQVRVYHPDAVACRAALASAATACGVGLPCLNAAVNACRPAAARFPNFGPAIRALQNDIAGLRGEVGALTGRVGAVEQAAADARRIAEQALEAAKKGDCSKLPSEAAVLPCVNLTSGSQDVDDTALQTFEHVLIGGEGDTLDPKIFAGRSGSVETSGTNPYTGSYRRVVRVDPPKQPRRPMPGTEATAAAQDKSTQGAIIGGILGAGTGAATGCGVGLAIDPGEDTSSVFDNSGCGPGALIGVLPGALIGAWIGHEMGEPDVPAQTAGIAPTGNGGMAAFWSGTF